MPTFQDFQNLLQSVNSRVIAARDRLQPINSRVIAARERAYKAVRSNVTVPFWVGTGMLDPTAAARMRGDESSTDYADIQAANPGPVRKFVNDSIMKPVGDAIRTVSDPVVNAIQTLTTPVNSAREAVRQFINDAATQMGVSSDRAAAEHYVATKNMRDLLADVNSPRGHDAWRTSVLNAAPHLEGAIPEQYDPDWQHGQLKQADAVIDHLGNLQGP